MAIIGFFELKVEPSNLKDKATSVQKSIQEVKTLFAQIENVVNSTKSIWVGEAGDMHRKTYEASKDKINEMIRRLEEHPVDLMKMAGVYDTAENEAKAVSQAQRGDVIV